MITVQDLEPLLFAGGDVVGGDGKKIGSVGQLFLDARTGNPAWVTVRTGMFGKAESFIPMAGAELHGSELHVPHTKDAVKHAPRIESADGHLSPDEERDLYRHYGLLHDDAPEARDTGDVVPDGRGVGDAGHGRHAADAPDVEPGADAAGATAGYGAAGPASVGAPPVPTNAPAPVAPTSPGPPPLTSYDDARAESIATSEPAPPDTVPSAGGGAIPIPAAEVVGSAVPAGAVHASTSGSSAPPRTDTGPEGVVLSGEQARVVGTEQVPTERVRMRRHTVTEQKQITVPVQREEVRVEYEPVDDDVPPGATPDPADTTHETDPRHGFDRPDDSRR